MLIATKFKRPGAPVTIGDTTYFFKPRDPANAQSEHVAEVTDTKHVQRLLSISEGYYLPEDTAEQLTAAKPVVSASGVSAEDGVEPPTGGFGSVGGPDGIQNADGTQGTEEPPENREQAAEGAGTENPQEDPDQALNPAEVQAAAQALNDLTWQKLSAELKKGDIPKEVIKVALDIELSRPEAVQRASTIKYLTQALEG
ncbi:MAG: hypothetical protein LBL59_08740 [Xanthomonadaceae bacterium]|jgi:hypothetical protein|nr:hypothetical protein [Xanthomonadaceae bacterium]